MPVINPSTHAYVLKQSLASSASEHWACFGLVLNGIWPDFCTQAWQPWLSLIKINNWFCCKMQHSNNLQMHGVHKINFFNLCLTQSIQVIILLFFVWSNIWVLCIRMQLVLITKKEGQQGSPHIQEGRMMKCSYSCPKDKWSNLKIQFCVNKAISCTCLYCWLVLFIFFIYFLCFYEVLKYKVIQKIQR